MQDPFTGQPTRLGGQRLPGAAERDALQDDHERRLAALARLGAAAAECGLRADSDRDLVLLAGDEVSLLESAGGPWPAQGDDMSRLLPAGLIEIPSRFLRANRDHPRLFFLGRGREAQPFLVADLHARNFVRGIDGGLHVIDLVAAPWPPENEGERADWIARKRLDPHAPALPGARDDEL